MKPIIVLYHGGKEYCDFEYFARNWIQDHLVAADIAEAMLATSGPYPFNEGDPEYYMEFEVLDRDKLRHQMKASLTNLPTERSDT